MLLLLIGIVSITTSFTIGAIFYIVGSFGLIFLNFLLGFALFNNIGFRDLLKKNVYNMLNTTNLLLSILLSLTIPALIIGAIFKIQHWPYGNDIVIYCSILLFAFTALGIFRYNKSSFHKANLHRYIFYTFFAAIFIYRLPWQYFM